MGGVYRVDKESVAIYSAKRGDVSGRKQVYRKKGCFDDIVTLASASSPKGYATLLTDLLVDGKIVRDFKQLDTIRKANIEKIKLLSRFTNTFRWR